MQDWSSMGLPMSFGSSSKSAVSSEPKAKANKTLEPVPPTKAEPESTEPPTSTGLADTEADAPVAGATDTAATPDIFPLSQNIELKDHTRAVCALSIDAAGVRLASGSYDYDCKLWDFNGMGAERRPFRSFEVKEGHQVLDLKFSLTGAHLLAVDGSEQTKLFDRDGAAAGEFIKGDRYIRDLRNTKGHVAAVTCVQWHPKQPNVFLTASADSTMRLWDVNNKRESTAVIVVKSKERGNRTKVYSCAFSPDARTIACACEDGAMHLYATKSNFARPTGTVLDAHVKGEVTGSIVFNSKNQLASRSSDGTVKLWDTKSFKKPLHVADQLPVSHPETNLIFSPDEKYILTGVAANKAEGKGGELVILNSSDLSIYRRVPVSPASVIKVVWSTKLNQIAVGSADGSVRVFYSPELSTKGALLVASKQPKRKHVDDFYVDSNNVGVIIAPHTLPMYADDGSAGRTSKRQREKQRHDPQKTMKPMPPVVGPGHGGRVGASATQHVVQNLIKDNRMELDPREALLKYANPEDGNGKWTSAWAKTQPKTLFDYGSDTEKEEEKK